MLSSEAECACVLICTCMAAAAKLLQSCPTLRPHGLQPTRLLHPWDFPGKSTGVGCHCLLRYVNGGVLIYICRTHNTDKWPSDLDMRRINEWRSLVAQSTLQQTKHDVHVRLRAQSCPILYDPMDCSPPGSSVHGIPKARILEWLPFSPPGIFLIQGSDPRLLH